MDNESLKCKLGSMFIIMIFVISGLLIINSEIPQINATSSWTQISNSDFDNGTINNLTIIGSGNDAELKINLSELHHWTKKTPVSKPNPRYDHAMASVWGTDKVVLFGGYPYYVETWIYDLKNNTWLIKNPSTKPSYRSGHAMVTIPGTDQLLLFGGSNNLYPMIKNDTWIYDLSDNIWTEKTPANPTPTNNPSGRSYHAMATVGTDKVVLFGGVNGYNETWVYDLKNNTWSKKNPSTKPSYRYDHAMASVWGTDEVVLFGGDSNNNETWVYDLNNGPQGTWTEKFPTNKPSGRYEHAMASVWGTDKVVLFGGYRYSFGVNDETWVYDLKNNTWTDKTRWPRPVNYPSARHEHAIATIWGTEKVVLFGGFGVNNNKFSDTWIYQHNLPTKNGTYISGLYDTCSNASFITISWNAITPEYTNITFQLRTAIDKSNLHSKAFIGPDGSISSYYISSPSVIWSGHCGDRWVQYKAYLNISIFTDSPILRDVTITYNCWPNTTLFSPQNEIIITDNKPTFIWNFTDQDSVGQAAFQVVIDSNNDFSNIDFNSDIQTSTNSQWQFPAGTSYSELPDGTWYWKVRTKDSDDDWGLFSDPWKLIVDSGLPTSEFTCPANNSFYNKMNPIYGTALDTINGTGLNKVELSIKILKDDKYWDGTAWISDETWLLAIGTTDWYYDTSTVTWSSDTQYLIQSKATDNATNIEIPGVGVKFSIDFDTPVSNIITPMDNSFLNKLESISGTSTDAGGANVQVVEICIKSIDENKYWDGTAWASTESWLPATGTAEWAFDSSEVSWKTDTNYLIRSKACDRCNNIESPSQGITFMYDDRPPIYLSIIINNGEEYSNSPSVELSLGSIDYGSGVYQMAFTTDAVSWSDWEEFNNTKSFDLPDGDGEKKIFFRVIDRAGNIAKPVYDTITLDTTPPEQLSIEIKANAEYTNSKMVTINLNAVDIISGLKDVSFSFDSITWTDWESFDKVKIINLTSEDGEKIIYFRARDNAGNTNVTSDTIILDTTPPHSLGIIINEGASETDSELVTLKLTAIDETSGVSQMSFFNVEGIIWDPWETFSETKTFSLSTGNGEKTIYFRVKDRAGNIAAPVSATILLNISSSQVDSDGDDTDGKKQDTIPGLSTIGVAIIFIIIIIVIILVIVALILTRKKQSGVETMVPEPSLPSEQTTMEAETQVPDTPAPEVPPTEKVESTTPTPSQPTLSPPLTPTPSITTTPVTPSLEPTVTPTPQQIPSVVTPPQLPPAAPTPVPAVETPSPAPEIQTTIQRPQTKSSESPELNTKPNETPRKDMDPEK